MGDNNSEIINQFNQIRKQFRSKSRGRNHENSFIIKKQDMYHNAQSKSNLDQINSLLPQKNQFSLDLSKIKVNNSEQAKEEAPVMDNSSYALFQQELNSQYESAVQDQIQSERTQKQKQLYIPNLNKYLEEFKKRKYQSPSVSQKIVGKNPYQNVDFPQEYVQKLADDMMDSFRSGKSCAKYDSIMDFIKGKPFYLKLGEMNYRQSEKNKVDLQDQPSSLQYQHIRLRNLQMGERPLSKEKRREQEQQTQIWVEQGSSSKQMQMNDISTGRSSSLKQRRELISSQISKRDASKEQSRGSEIKIIENNPTQTPKANYFIWNPPNMNQSKEKAKLNNFLSHQVTPRQGKQLIPLADKRFKQDLSISRTTFDAGVENDFTIDQPSTKHDDFKSPQVQANRSKQVSPLQKSQESYNTFLTQDIVQQNFENSNQRINDKRNDKDIAMLLQGDCETTNNKKQNNQKTPVQKNNLDGQDLLSPGKNHFKFEKQILQKLNLKLEDQLRQRSKQQNRNSFTHRERPNSENKQDQIQFNSKANSPIHSYRIQNLSRVKPRSVAGRRFPNKEDSAESLACGSILLDCNSILEGSSISQIGQPNYFNEKYYEKNCIQNEKKHKIKKEFITIWQQSKEKYKQRKENLLSEIEEQALIVKQYKDEQPLIKTQLQKSGAVIDRYFNSLNVVKPFFQKKVQQKSIV